MPSRLNTQTFLFRFLALTGGRIAGALATFLTTLLIAHYWGSETLGTLARRLPSS